MNYHLLDDPELVHNEFRRRFTLPYGAFCHAHADWLSTLPEHCRRNYTQSYFDRLPYSDRLTPGFAVLPLSDALEELAQLGPVCFLTNPPGGLMHDYAVLGTEHLWAAQAAGTELAQAIRDDWFKQYELWDQGMHDPKPLFGSEVFAFTADLCRCIVYTHETDEMELPETRVCLSFSA